MDIDSKNPSACFALAHFYKLTDREDLSIPLFEKYIELKRESEQGSVKAQLHLAEIYADKGEYQKVEVLCKEVLEVDCQNVLAPIQLATVLCYQDRFEDAIDVLAPLINFAHEEELETIHYMLGKIHKEKGNYAHAAKYLEQYTKLSSYPYSGLVELSEVYNWLDKYVEAANAMKEALKLNSEDFWNWIFLSRIYINMKEYDLAIQACNSSLEIENNAEAYYWLSMIFLRKGNFEDSQNYAKKACAIDESNPKYHSILGYSNLKFNKIDEAIKEIEITLNLKDNANKDFLGGFQTLGDTLTANGFTELANQCFEAEKNNNESWNGVKNAC